MLPSLQINDIFENISFQKQSLKTVGPFQGTDVLLIRRKQYHDAEKIKVGMKQLMGVKMSH